jgi:hypothetical protein
VDLADVRVVQRGDCARLLLEAMAVRRVQPFDGDNPIEPDVAGFPDLAHPAAAERLKKLIWTQADAGTKTHGELRSGL